MALVPTGRSVRHVRREPPTVRGERVIGVRSQRWWHQYGWVLDGDRFTVRKVRHQGGSLSHCVFTPDAEVHRPSLNVLKRYGTSSQQTYAYGLADHLNWARVNGKTPETVTLEDLQR
jgi:hypothetical protein